MEKDPKNPIVSSTLSVAFEASPNHLHEETGQEEYDLQMLHHSKRKHKLSLKQILFIAIFIVAMVIVGIFLYVYTRDPPNNSYILPASWYKTYPDLTQVKGKHKEAYAFLLCSGPSYEVDFYFDTLMAFMHRLIKLGELEKRDIIVTACNFTTDQQFDTIYKLGVIVLPVEHILPDRNPTRTHWKYNFAKFHIWKLIFWDRILFLDIDLLCKDGLLNLWDDPATQFITEPPEGFNLNEIYFGQPISSLYPYIAAYAYDTWRPDAVSWEYFNNGIFVINPTIAQWNVLMNVTFDLSIDLPTMEQDALNVVYSKKGPVPWRTFNETYNITPLNYNISDWIICYHGKFWWNKPEDYYYQFWRGRVDDMFADVYLVNIDIEPKLPRCFTTSDSLTVDGLRLTSDNGILYYMVTTNLTYMPSSEEIKQRYKETGKPNVLISKDKKSGFTVENLSSDTKYKVFYYADTTMKYHPMTDIYFLNCTTSSN